MSLWSRGWLVPWGIFITSLELPKCTRRQTVKYSLLVAGTFTGPLGMFYQGVGRREDHGVGSKSSSSKLSLHQKITSVILQWHKRKGWARNPLL